MRFLKIVIAALLLMILMACSLQAQGADSILYKQVDSALLYLHMDMSV